MTEVPTYVPVISVDDLAAQLDGVVKPEIQVEMLEDALAQAEDVAPCLRSASLPAERRMLAKAIIRDAVTFKAMSLVKYQAIGGDSVSYNTPVLKSADVFSAEQIARLRALCPVSIIKPLRRGSYMFSQPPLIGPPTIEPYGFPR